MKQKSRLIGDETYYATPLDAVAALKIQTKLIKIIGPSALALVGNKVESVKDLIPLLPKMLPSLLSNFDDEKVNDLVLMLFERNIFTMKAGALIPIEFSTYFVGKLTDMWKVVAFILEVNFSTGEQNGSTSHITGEGSPTQES